MSKDEHDDKYLYMETYGRQCAVCHWPSDRKGRWMELHHIVGGRGRKDITENWIPLCCRCHHACHNTLPEYGELPKGAILRAKAELDGCNPEVLASLLHKKSLSYEECDIPEKFLQDRRKTGGKPWP